MGDDSCGYHDLFDGTFHRPDSEWIELEVKKIIAATGKAFLCRLDDDKEYWVPFSQIRDHDEFEAGDTECVLHITEWINDRLEPVEKKSVFDQRAKGGQRQEPE